MKVCNLSLDKKIMISGSAVEKRLISLAEVAGEIVVLVPGIKDECKKLSANLTVHSVGGGKLVQFFKLWKKAKKVVGAGKFDLITVQDVSCVALIGFFVSRKFRIPFEIQVHGLEKFYGIRKWIAGFMFRRADKIRVVSARLKQLLTTNYKLQTKNIYVLPIYTQISAPSEISHVKANGKGNFTFLTVGRLVPVKNISIQIEAFSKISKEFPNALLKIVGEGALEESLKLQAKSLQLQDEIQFEGRQENLEKYYREADTFLLTSDSEGWGLVVTEASAYGLPIIMTDVGLAGEFLHDGENGIVVPVRDEQALISAMRRVITDASLRERLSQNTTRSFHLLPGAEQQIKLQVEQWASFI